MSRGNNHKKKHLWQLLWLIFKNFETFENLSAKFENLSANLRSKKSFDLDIHIEARVEAKFVANSTNINWRPFL